MTFDKQIRENVLQVNGAMSKAWDESEHLPSFCILAEASGNQDKYTVCGSGVYWQSRCWMIRDFGRWWSHRGVLGYC